MPSQTRMRALLVVLAIALIALSVLGITLLRPSSQYLG